MTFLAAPLVVPLATALATFALARRPRAERAAALLGALALLLTHGAIAWGVWQDGLQVSQMGSWPAPFGITLAVDTLSAALLVAVALVHLAVTVSGVLCPEEAPTGGRFWPLANVMVMGVDGAFVTGDLFNLYVWFEVLLMASFALVALARGALQIEATVKYVVLNLVASATFLVGIALLYSVTGTLNMADLARTVPTLEPGLGRVALPFLVVAFGAKAAAFPLAFWLPSAYGAPPATATALFAGLLTKVGVYALLRTATLLYATEPALVSSVLLALAAASLLAGALGALASAQLRHVLSFYLVAAVGFMLLGPAIGGPKALSASVFYLVTDMLVITGLFLLAGAFERLTGEREYPKMGGIWSERPGLAVAFLVLALSVAGFPPLVGFWGKVGLFSAAIAADRVPVVLLGLASSAILLLSVGQVWSRGLWAPARGAIAGPGRARAAGALALAGLVVALSVWPGPLYEVAARAGAQLAEPAAYIEEVLGG